MLAQLLDKLRVQLGYKFATSELVWRDPPHGCRYVWPRLPGSLAADAGASLPE